MFGTCWNGHMVTFVYLHSLSASFNVKKRQLFSFSFGSVQLFFLSFDHPAISAAIVFRFRLRHIHKQANSEIPLASNCLDGDRRNSVSDILKREMKLFLWDDSHTRWKHNWIFCEWKCAQLWKWFRFFPSSIHIYLLDVSKSLNLIKQLPATKKMNERNI